MKADKSGGRALFKFAYEPGGRFTAINATLVDMIVRVYPTRRIQMQGGPSWIDADRFDVEAKADASEGAIKDEQWQEMVQTLLEDRFQLKYHVESRDMAVLAMVTEKNAPKPAPAQDGEETGMTPGENGRMVFRRMPAAGLGNLLSNLLHAPVVDRTGLTGLYDFTLDPNSFVTPGEKESMADLVVAAAREQLGWKLEKSRAKLDITIIDRAERPEGN